MFLRRTSPRCQTIGLLCLLVIGVRVQAADDPVEARMRQDLTYLASDPLEGRGVGTKGNSLAAQYIADQFKKAGLKPGGKDGSYFQPFTINGGTLEGMPQLALTGPQGQHIVLRAGTQFEPLGLSRSGQLKNAPLVFAGYGVTITKEGGNETVYDDYQDLDVKGKVVIVLRDLPRAGNRYAPLPTNPRWRSMAAKLSNAEDHGAVGVLLVSDHRTAVAGDDLLVFSMTAPDASPAKLPAFHVRRSVVADLLQGSAGGTLADREAAIDAELKPHSSPLAGWIVSLDIRVEKGIVSRNVVGVLEGSGPLANETVIVGAHYDHLGYGGAGSIAGLSKPAIHHGADDNASGTTAVIELARRFGQMPRREGRRLAFMTFSGEERGLLGSAYYCKEPLFPLEQTVAMVNLDMVGRLRPDPESKKGRLLVYGAGSATILDALVGRLSQNAEIKLIRKHDRLFSASDHYSFYVKQIPVLFFFTDDHSDYHRPSDTAEKINYHGMHAIVDLAQQILTELRTTSERPQFVKLPSLGGGYGGGRRLGIRPSYGDDQDGVLLEGVADDGPAAKAGLKGGDRIVEIGGKPVKNIEAYMSIMAGLKQGETVELGVLRQGQKVTIKILPE